VSLLDEIGHDELTRSDGNIRYYEYEGDSLHYLNEYKSSDPRELSAIRDRV
jgi:hypothetical protein